MTKSQKETKRNLDRIDDLWVNGNKEDARKLAKRVSWRTLLLYLTEFIEYDSAIYLADDIKGIDNDWL
jgi:hypothetical protein